MELSHTFRIQNLILYNAHSTFDLQSNYRGEFLDKEQRSQGLVSASVLVSFRTIYTTTKSQDSLISIFRVADPIRVCIYITCVYVYAFTLHACTCMHVRYLRIRVCMYGTCVYVYAFTLHACACMHVRYMRVRVCMYGTCVYVYAFTLHACTLHACTVPAYTCTHVRYMRVRICMYVYWAIPLNKHTPPVDERYLQFNPLDMADPSNPPGQPQNTPLDN